MFSHTINLIVISVFAVIWANKATAFPSDYHSTKCNCVLLQDCDSFKEFIDETNNISLIKSTIKEAVCEFDGWHIFVCCPEKINQKRHAKDKPKLDYLDELTGLNCPPSFGKEYNYDEYLQEHPEDDDVESNTKGEPQNNGGRDPIYCNHWGNCGRFKFPKDDGPGNYKPPPMYRPQHDYGYGNDHGHGFRVPFFPFHHHHHHGDEYDDHKDDDRYTSQEITTSPPSPLSPTSPPNAQGSIQCGTLPKATSDEVYPWIVRLAYLNITSRTIRYRCLGTIITDQHILTAAHCVDNLVQDLRLIFARIGDDTNFEDFKIIETTIHPNYNEPLFNNDVALLRLAKTQNSKIPIVPICLPQNNGEISMGNTGIVAAWSDNGKSNVAAAPIRYINLPILNNTECAIRYAKYSENFENNIVITPSEFCAKSEAMNDVCEGDSGGPFMNRSDNGRYTLLGIVAFGPKTNCGQSNLPGVYMRVNAYVDWIQQKIT